MAWQKGPGEGYMAAKDATLALDPSLKCQAVYYNGRRIGFVVVKGRKTVGRGKLSRDAWGEAYFAVGGKFPVPSML